MTHYINKALYFQAQDSGGVWRVAYSNSNAIVDSDWHYVAVTYSRPNVVFYVDGKYWGTASRDYDMKSTSSSLFIGSMVDTNYFNGQIDGVKIYNRALSAEEVRYHYNQGKPVAQWDFDEGEGTRAFDVSGNNNTGVLTNGPTWVEGKHGSALSFDGVDDYVNCPGGNLALTGDLTISAWIKLNSTSGYHWIVSKNYAKEYTFGTHNSELRFYHGDGSYYASDSLNAGLSSNNWYYVSVSRDTDQKKVKFYVNGKYISEWNYTNDITSSTQMVKIGTRSDDYSWFDGFIDEVKIHNYARTEEQIMQDYNAGLATHLK